jgi:hypothetical protein
MNFDKAPMLVIWEVTQACDLACVHCRASAQPERHPQELTTREGFQLLEEIRRFGEPLVVLTGGDPPKRPDLYDLLRYSVKIGLRTNVTPSATPLLTAEAIDGLQRAGISRLAISVDGPNAATHDEFRGIPGTFERAAAARARAPMPLPATIWPKIRAASTSPRWWKRWQGKLPSPCRNEVASRLVDVDLNRDDLIGLVDLNVERSGAGGVARTKRDDGFFSRLELGTIDLDLHPSSGAV